MKLVIAIVQQDDGNKALSQLNAAGYSVTKLATTGGFLRAGNMTLMAGVEEKEVDGVIDILNSTCSSRTKIISSPAAMGMADVGSNYPINVNVGGATVFVVDVDRFEKL